MKRLLLVVYLSAGAAVACGSVQDFGALHPGPSAGDDGGLPGVDGGSARTGRWNWLNPTPQGNDLRGVWGTADDDVWMAGARGTVVRWNGSKAEMVYEGPAEQDLYAVWGSAKNDVWIAGQGGNRNLLHWDGTTFSWAYSIASQSIHSLWGTSANDVWALGVAGSTFHFDGRAWKEVAICNFCEDATPAPVLRDLWGAAPGDLWAVGDGGAIFHFVGGGWVDAKPWPPTGEKDPFASENNYLGVWGSAANDVWAVYVNAPPTRGTREVGFSHFDGATWRVTQAETGGVYEAGSEPRRRGHRVWGTGANDILAMTDSSAWRYDGIHWTAQALRTELPYGAVWGSPGRGFLAVGADGAFLQLDRSASAIDPRAWVDVLPALRSDLSDVSSASDGSVWAVAYPYRLVRWTTEGWADAAPIVGTHIMSVSAVRALSSDDVWVAGTDRDGDGTTPNQNYAFVARYDGKAWSPQQRLPMTMVTGFWVRNANDAWAVGFHGQVARWSGTAWTVVPWSGNDTLGSAFGTSENDVWIAGDRVVLRWDGSLLREVVRSDAVTGQGIWASGLNDVWVAGQPGLHWDGARWSPLEGTDYMVRATWGSDRNDVWQLVNTGEASSVMHWDGRESTPMLSVSGLTAISGTGPYDVWAVGSGGVTLRYTATDSSVPR